MKRTTIQFRIAVWYFLSAALILAILATGSWVAMRASMIHSIDRDLHYRLGQVIPYLQAHGLNSAEQFQREFGEGADSPVVGVFVQFTDDGARILYESDILRLHNVPVLEPGPNDGSIAIATAGGRGKWPVRAASRRIFVRGVPLTVHLVEPLRDMFGSLHEYTLDLGLLLLAGFVLTTLAGYLLSRHALAPVERIRLQAEAIDQKNLDARLPVPHADDELKRLAQTLNAMLARIESGFQAVQQFTADASHELRAPLTLIVTACEISLRRQRSREELQDTLSKVLREGRNMSKLVDQLLTLARNDVEREEAATERVDIASLAREVCDQFLPLAGEKGLRITCTTCDGEVPVRAHETDVRRLLLILLDNAIKYTESGLISVAVDCRDNRVQVTVTDTGIGIESTALPQIFNRFWRADKARSRGDGGAGLGLSLAAQIVAKSRGAITAKSEVGIGSVVMVDLPRAEQAFRASSGQPALLVD